MKHGKAKSVLFIFLFTILPDMAAVYHLMEGKICIAIGCAGAVIGTVCAVLAVIYDVDILYYYKYLLPNIKNKLTKTTIILAILLLCFTGIFGIAVLSSIFLADMTDRTSHKIILVLTNPIINYNVMAFVLIIDFFVLLQT